MSMSTVILVWSIFSLCSVYPLLTAECQMERLRSLGIDPNVPKSELVSALLIQSTDVQISLRQAFFTELVREGLGDEGDELVSRRSTGSKSLSTKLSEDIYSLLHCLKNNLRIPRSVVKNGKRDKNYLEASRALSQSQISSQSQSLPNAPPLSRSNDQDISRHVSLASVMKELNSLKETVRTLKGEVTSLHREKQTLRAPSTCHISIACKTPRTASELPSLVGCPILNAVQVGLFWKAKIHRHCLYDAIQSTSDTHSVHIWENNHSKQPPPLPSLSNSPSLIQGKISIVTWNCRGYHNSKPYLRDLIAKGADIIVLQEHWLWPYELSSLGSLHPNYSYIAVSDKRLNPECDLQRGCGGVAIIWNKSLKCSPISTMDSDQICGIRLFLPPSNDTQRSLALLGVYMPSAEQPQECFSSHLESVEHIISQLNSHGPMIVVGDLNAHLGSRDPDAQNACNSRGLQWNSVIHSHSLYNVSLGCLSSGPMYTFSSGENTSTIDYVLANQDASRGIRSCVTFEDHPLNTSDHLPLMCTLELSHLRSPTTPAFPSQSLDWAQGETSQCTVSYANSTDDIARPLLCNDYTSIEEVEHDIRYVCQKLIEAADLLIPKKKKKTKSTVKVRDKTLSHLCWKSRCAFRNWKSLGRPRSGPIADERKRCKRDVKSHLNKCRARKERRRIQQRDEMIQQNHPKRFRSTFQEKFVCTKLYSNGTVITDSKELLDCWADHFCSLGQSQCDSNESLSNSQRNVNDILSATFCEQDDILDTTIDVEEVEYAIRRLKRNRAGGPDLISPEHLKFSGPVFRNWLCQIFNHICQLERIPQCFKHGIIIPAFKGKGRDPLLKKSYRGITLTSVLAKVFEIVLLQRINPVLEDAGVPQIYQTAYRKDVSCQDSIFAGQETFAKFAREGDNVYSCFYDLASAFDTVEFCVLLEELFHAGVKGKCWRLIQQWYRDPISQVRLGDLLSKPFNINRGIRQGSVLSPTLFNLVMDPLLCKLRQKQLGLSVNGLFLGAFAHADDIRSSAANLMDAKEQVTTVDSFTKSRGLHLCPEKCALLHSSHQFTPSSISIGEACLPVEKSVKCLGVWWDTAPSSKTSVTERINKARAALFSHGQLGAFHGSLNPLSSRSIVESCILPVLMYGSESWVLNKTLLKTLESFQAEVGKRILKLPKFTSNNVPLLALNWPSMCARILCSKLCFLHRVCHGQNSSLASQVFNTIATTDVTSMCLVKQCQFLESTLGAEFTNEVLTQPDLSLRNLKERIIKADRSKTLENAEAHPSLKYVLQITKENAWMKYWDTALEHGINGTRSSLSILKLLSLTVLGDRNCPASNCSYVLPDNHSLCEHFINCHTDLPAKVTPDSLSNSIISIVTDTDHFATILPLGLSIVSTFPF